MQLAWMTDLHLNFLTPAGRLRFLETVRDQGDAFVITGDIAESRNVVGTLAEMLRGWQKPVHFVLGNHDFYRGSIRTTRAEVAHLAEAEPLLTYLTAAGVVELSPQTALVGHDGWADARLGGFEGSPVILNDYLQIDELRKWRPDSMLDKPALGEVLNSLGDEAARHLEAVLVRRQALGRQLPAPLRLPSGERGDAARHASQPAILAAGAVRAHARQRRDADPGQPAGADGRGRIRPSGDPAGAGCCVMNVRRWMRCPGRTTLSSRARRCADRVRQVGIAMKTRRSTLDRRTLLAVTATLRPETGHPVPKTGRLGPKTGASGTDFRSPKTNHSRRIADFARLLLAPIPKPIAFRFPPCGNKSRLGSIYCHVRRDNRLLPMRCWEVWFPRHLRQAPLASAKPLLDERGVA
jgi:hypothetical protein